MSLAQNIKRIRLHRNYTQKYIALALGTSLANYSKMENGMINISKERQEKIAGILDVTLEELMGSGGEA
ncbi:helix-turn-helix domain-containing protein [Taibaiella helva]|uniref:helix-turn-helix domain-containing protein n=1 Tax=Taibaiella helva TaxID=2301235 RepID=UPI00130064E5|nr:helix-turn-helix transcriptional regulator [Taibaiella helva]